MKYLKKNAEEKTMSQLELEEAPYRPDHHGYWTAAICFVLAVAMIVASLPTAKTSSVSVNSKVLSGKISQHTISTVLSGAGTVVAAESESVKIPTCVELKAYHVHNGDHVDVGDPLATVDKVQTRSAIVELQSAIRSLDDVLKYEKDALPDQVVKSATNGRIKEIYVQSGDDVAQVIRDKGSLMLVSLDGCMAVDTEQDLSIGDTYQVTLSDGSVLKGTVNAVKDGIATITVSDATAPVHDSVVVTDSTGNLICEGSLYVHSPVNIMCHYGTVSYVTAKVNQIVNVGSNLMSLRDLGHTTKYEYLMGKRADFEERMAILSRMATDGVLRAQVAGIVNGVDDTVDFEEFQKEQPRSMATPGDGFEVLFSALKEGNGETGEGEKEKPEEEEGSEAIYLLSTESAHYFYQGGTITSSSKDKVFCTETGESVDSVSPGSTVIIYDNRIVVTGDIGADVMEILNSLLQQITGNPKLTLDVVMGILNGDTDALMALLMGEMDLESLMAGMMGAFSFGGFGSASQPLYETYDMSEKQIVELLSPDEVTISIQVDELDILSLEEGMETVVSLDAIRGQSFTGVIDHINYYGTNEGGNTKYTVDVNVSRTEKMLENMNASVKVTTDVSEPMDTIPVAALQEESGKTFVFTSYDAKKDVLGGKVEVQTGISDGENVQIVSGLDANTTYYYRYADSMDYQIAG